MRKFVTSFLRDDSGASAAEYALILAIIGTGIAVAAIALADQIEIAFERASGELTNANELAAAS